MDAVFRVSSWKLSCSLLQSGIEEKDIQLQIFRNHAFFFRANTKQMAHDGSTCPLSCTTDKHFLDEVGRGPELQRQKRERGKKQDGSNFKDSGLDHNSHLSWISPNTENSIEANTQSSRRWVSSHGNQEKQQSLIHGGLGGGHRNDKSKGEGKHKICDSETKCVLINCKNHRRSQTPQSLANPHRFTQTLVDHHRPL